MKKYLLDTHLLLWTIEDPNKLPEKAAKIIAADDENIRICCSIVSVWEIVIKQQKRPDKISSVSLDQLKGYCEKSDFDLLPLEFEHVRALQTLTRPDDAPPHKDPFDRMLIAQAKAEDMIFLTHDDLLPYYNEPFITLV